MGIAGRSLVIVTVSLALYNIISADDHDHARATAKEGVVVGSSLGAMVAGGYVASLTCGPGAFFCTAAWTFSIGAAAAIGSEAIFDEAW